MSEEGRHVHVAPDGTIMSTYIMIMSMCIVMMRGIPMIMTMMSAATTMDMDTRILIRIQKQC